MRASQHIENEMKNQVTSRKMMQTKYSEQRNAEMLLDSLTLILQISVAKVRNANSVKYIEPERLTLALITTPG